MISLNSHFFLHEGHVSGGFLASITQPQLVHCHFSTQTPSKTIADCGLRIENGFLVNRQSAIRNAVHHDLSSFFNGSDMITGSSFPPTSRI